MVENSQRDKGTSVVVPQGMIDLVGNVPWGQVDQETGGETTDQEALQEIENYIKTTGGETEVKAAEVEYFVDKIFSRMSTIDSDRYVGNEMEYKVLQEFSSRILGLAYLYQNGASAEEYLLKVIHNENFSNAVKDFGSKKIFSKLQKLGSEEDTQFPRGHQLVMKVLQEWETGDGVFFSDISLLVATDLGASNKDIQKRIDNQMDKLLKVKRFGSNYEAVRIMRGIASADPVDKKIPYQKRIIQKILDSMDPLPKEDFIKNILNTWRESFEPRKEYPREATRILASFLENHSTQDINLLVEVQDKIIEIFEQIRVKPSNNTYVLQNTNTGLLISSLVLGAQKLSKGENQERFDNLYKKLNKLGIIKVTKFGLK